jgi:hypothetical protein
MAEFTTAFRMYANSMGAATAAAGAYVEEEVLPVVAPAPPDAETLDWIERLPPEKRAELAERVGHIIERILLLIALAIDAPSAMLAGVLLALLTSFLALYQQLRPEDD